MADLTEELGGSLSAAELLQVRVAASLQLHVEDLTARMVRGEQIDPEEATRAGNSAIRALQSIKRRKELRRPTKGDGFRALQASLAAKREAAA